MFVCYSCTEIHQGSLTSNTTPSFLQEGVSPRAPVSVYTSINKAGLSKETNSGMNQTHQSFENDVRPNTLSIIIYDEKTTHSLCIWCQIKGHYKEKGDWGF